MKMLGGVGSIGGLPVKAGAVSLESADMAALIGAASGLIKVLVGVGAGALALAFAVAILEEKRLRKAEQISIGSLAIIKTQNRNFFGVLLDEKLKFTCENENFQISTDRISEIKKRWSAYSAYKVELVDGSTYEDVNIVTKEIKFASVAGIQTVEIPHRELTTVIKLEKASLLTACAVFCPLLLPFVFYTKRIKGRVSSTSLSAFQRWLGFYAYEEFKWKPSDDYNDYTFSVKGVSWSDIGALRKRLTFVLEHNAQAVIKELGEEVFNQYFRYEPT